METEWINSFWNMKFGSKHFNAVFYSILTCIGKFWARSVCCMVDFFPILISDDKVFSDQLICLNRSFTCSWPFKFLRPDSQNCHLEKVSLSCDMNASSTILHSPLCPWVVGWAAVGQMVSKMVTKWINRVN